MVAYYPSGGRFPDFILTRLPGWNCGGLPYKSRGPSWRPDDPNSGSKTLFFSGLAVANNELIRSAAAYAGAAASESLTGIGRTTSFAGCYTAVLRSSHSITIVNDLFGLCPLYYLNQNGAIIVSNRAHLVSLMMLKSGIRREPNLDVICTSLASNHRLLHHPYCHETVLRGLRICPADSFLVVDDENGLTTTRKSEHSVAAPSGNSPEAYRSLVDQAANDIRRNVTAAINSREFSYRILDISGGKDSRLVFGAVGSVNLLSRCFAKTFRSQNPLDLDTGMAISQMFGVGLDSGDWHRSYSKRSQFAIGFWRSMRTGMHHPLGANNWPTMWHGTKAIRLNGGCGEIYRDLWAEEQLLHKIENPDRFSRICWPGLPAHWKTVAFQSLWRAIDTLPGDNAAAKLCNHYMFFRNRFHFGIPAYNEWYGYVPFSPLQSPSLLLASRLLSPSDRARGRAIHDVTERISPFLNRLPLANGRPWPQEFKSEALQHETWPVPHPQHEKIAAAFEASEAELSRSRRLSAVAVDRLVPSDTLFRTLEVEAGKALADMRQMDTNLARILDSRFARWTSQLATQPWSRPAAAILASKLLAIYDLCFDMSATALDLVSLPLHETYSETGFSAATYIQVGRLHQLGRA